MPNSPIRTRFAPSPTGDLHIGSARTALYCWLYARSTGGKFILRIEDTDRVRSTDAAVAVIHDAMAWLGLDADEGPFYQTQRMDRYQAVIDQLLASGHAYRCSCSTDRLDQLRESQRAAGEKPRYDGHCREKNVDPSQPHVIRFKNPTSGAVTFNDIIRGSITVENSELDDLIIARTDGTPTYNLTVVVDDWDMGMTHVIRGDDHINNTPRQINLFHALGAEPPLYGHVPMILGADGKRLSKRHGATSVLSYRDQGILPSALLNTLVRLGWSHGDQELFSMEELVEHFTLDPISRSPAIFDPEKLLWVNQQHMQQLSFEAIYPHLEPFLETQGTAVTDSPLLSEVIKLLAPRSKTLSDLAQQAHTFYNKPSQYAEKADKKQLNEKTKPILEAVLQKLKSLKEWTEPSCGDAIQSILVEHELKMGKVAQPLRVALTGDTNSPSIDITLALIGQEAACERIAAAIDHIEAKIENN